MKQPDTLIAKYYFLAFVGILIFFIFSVSMWVLHLGGECTTTNPKEEKKEKKKSNTIIHLLIFVLICSMAAQAVNQSYRKIVPNVVNAVIKKS
jgi:hypothetical protein